MIRLAKATIHRYKTFESEQEFTVEPDVTALVGLNESGKTSILEALAKSNYYQDDPDFEFASTHDYPRRYKKKLDKSGDIPPAVTCTFSIDPALLAEIAASVGEGVFKADSYSRTTHYNNRATIGGVSSDRRAFAAHQAEVLEIPSDIAAKVEAATDLKSLQALYEEHPDEKDKLSKLECFYQNNPEAWTCPISHHIYTQYLEPHTPKFLYYDEYYSLPSRIRIEELQSERLTDSSLKTAKALFDLADIQPEAIIGADDFEDFVAELEATEATISEELFEYWSTNTNLRIQFKIDKQLVQSEKAKRDVKFSTQQVASHVLDVRVWNERSRMSLPLRNRSKGFNWFFSFLVWFQRIQEDASTKYIILLDEPGLNLHASAQADLLRFIESLSNEYQLIFTTHSPFMVDPAKLHQIRTITEEPDGAVVSETVQEKNPKTLFPLQAALGYDIAQNLFISPRNLAIEGVSDLVYLQHMSELCRRAGKEGLKGDVTLVPTGGIEKVTSFISLLRGSKLNIATLLDTPNTQKVASQIARLVREKIVRQSKIKYFHEYVDGYEEADIEDMFEISEYLAIFNEAFRGTYRVEEGELEGVDGGRVVSRICATLGIDRYNHYAPARSLISTMPEMEFSDRTLNRFAAAFEAVNRALK